MRTALGATSPQKINSATRDRPSSAPVVMTNKVLNTKNGASCCSQTGERGLAERRGDRPGRECRRHRDRARRNGAHQGGKALQPDLSPMIVTMPRDMEQQNQRPADADRHAGEPIKAEGRHQVAETLLGKKPAQNDQHNELRSEPEHPRARADDQNVEIGPQPAVQQNAGNTIRDCLRQPHKHFIRRRPALPVASALPYIDPAVGPAFAAFYLNGRGAALRRTAASTGALRSNRVEAVFTAHWNRSRRGFGFGMTQV